MSLSRRRRLALLLALLATACSAGGSGRPWQPSAVVERGVLARSPSAPAGSRTAYVVRVVDGDTLVADLPGRPAVRVRLVGVDSPESVKPNSPVACFGPVASAYAKQLLTGVTVRVAAEPGAQTDRYGRELWDVWMPDGRFVAGLLVADGLGRAYPFPPQVQFAPFLQTVQAEARAAGRGLWGPPCHGRSFSTPDRAWPAP
ncbi:MAG: micrococcal nuclease [Frankiales bacterium]|jgi:micrococcal nuclease|nr:micrococcal nuclease [Frankiales bacterium]